MKTTLFMAMLAASLPVYAVPLAVYRGGPFDGYSRAAFFQYDRGVSPQFVSARFHGGEYDGYSSDMLRQYDRAVSPHWSSARFYGGSQDGYAFMRVDQYDRSSTPQWTSVRFLGGAMDGYAAVTLKQYDYASSPQWTSPRFSGGSYDGSDISYVTGIPNPLNGDLDADGLPDWWEALHYASIFATGPDGDTDFDGMSAWAEYVSGTQPTNAASVFQCMEFSINEGSNHWRMIRWSSTAGRTYAIYSVTNILGHAVSMLVTNLPATPPDNSWTNMAGDRGFETYRIEVSW